MAKDLLGKVIRFKNNGHWLSAVIIETEAYKLRDQGSHASLGQTPSRKALFMPPGTIYMYYARGGDSLNISCRGEGNAVLIKSGHYFQDQFCSQNSLEIMTKNNPISEKKRAMHRLCSGQTLLCKSLGVRVTHWNNKNFERKVFFIESIARPPLVPNKIIVTTRLGIPKGRDEHLPYRFIHYHYAPYCTQNPLAKRKATAGKTFFIERSMIQNGTIMKLELSQTVLESKILEHRKLYYSGQAKISNKEYDKLEEELERVAPNSPVLSKVGTEILSPRKLKHDTKMLSLNKTYKLDELHRWIGDEKVISMFKVDGLSCSLVYRKGKLALGKTRGDGQFGEDISEKVLLVKNIPRKVNLEVCEVRGEIYCNEKDFVQLSDEMARLELERPKSKRNIVAGLLGRKINIDLCRYLSFFAFDIISDELNLKSEWNKIEVLSDLGFQIPEHRQGVEDIIESVKLFMEKGHYLIDGAVFTYDDLALHDELGSTAHHPRYRMAFKLQGESKCTEIKEIIWSVSRKGHLIPVAKVEEVKMSGAKISRVGLHNYGQVKQHQLKRGDKIEILRSGEVIPKFLTRIGSSKEKFTTPGKCPSCGTRVEMREIHLICPNKKCPGRIKEGILYFIQKIGIDDLSSKRLDAMLKQGMINGITDLYRLDREKLLAMEKIKDKLATKILSEIEKSKKVDLVTFISALGISGGAYHKCEKVVNAGFDSIAKLKDMSIEQLSEVESFAEISSREFVESLTIKWKLVDELLELGFQLRAPTIKQGLLTGKKLVITGALSRKRSSIEKEINSHGGVVSNSVSKTTDYLITNNENSTSSKIKKAKELKIFIISEGELVEMMSGKK